MGQCASRGRRASRGGDEKGASSEKRGCMAVAKAQRSRFYIIRRCLIMLLCWHKYGKH